MSKTAFWRLLLDSKKLDLRVYIYTHANQGFRVSQTALKTAVFESQKEMFLSLKKAWKRITFYIFFSQGALSFLEVQKSTKVTKTYTYMQNKLFWVSKTYSKTALLKLQTILCETVVDTQKGMCCVHIYIYIYRWF